MEESLFSELKRIAQYRNTTISNILRDIIIQYLQHYSMAFFQKIQIPRDFYEHLLLNTNAERIVSDDLLYDYFDSFMYWKGIQDLSKVPIKKIIDLVSDFLIELFSIIDFDYKITPDAIMLKIISYTPPLTNIVSSFIVKLFEKKISRLKVLDIKVRKRTILLVLRESFQKTKK
ncbi:MAG: hypothetical protein ACP6IU_06525 [Candidatus Asgardarchaeia archaeon]